MIHYLDVTIYKTNVVFLVETTADEQRQYYEEDILYLTENDYLSVLDEINTPDNGDNTTSMKLSMRCLESSLQTYLQFVFDEINFDITSLRQFTEQNLSHQQRFQTLSNDSIHFTSTVLWYKSFTKNILKSCIS